MTPVHTIKTFPRRPAPRMDGFVPEADCHPPFKLQGPRPRSAVPRALASHCVFSDAHDPRDIHARPPKA